jgi:hypothetical protein
MRRILSVGILVLLVMLAFTAGCSNSGLGVPSKTTTKTGTPTATPTPAFGNLMIISKPVGASVYVEGEYRGTAPINITDLAVRKYNISIQMDQFSNNNFTAEVKGGQTVTISKTLSEAKPKITVTMTDASVQHIPPCIWTFIGTLDNTGDEILRETVLTLTMKPKSSAYKTVTKTVEIGDIYPGLPKAFSMQVTVLCEGDYQATLKWEGWEWNNLDTQADNKLISGTKNF